MRDALVEFSASWKSIFRSDYGRDDRPRAATRADRARTIGSSRGFKGESECDTQRDGVFL